MNKKTATPVIKHEPHKKTATVKDSRGHVIKLPKPHRNQGILKGL